MYVYQRAIVKEKGNLGRWLERDVSTIPMGDLYRLFDRVYLIVKHLIREETFSIDIEKINDVLQPKLAQSLTIEWLLKIGDETLPLEKELPLVDVMYAPYRDAWQAGYKIKPVHPTLHPDTPGTRSELTSLLLSKEGVDNQQLNDECLVTVNGFFHRTMAMREGPRVVDGAKSGFHAGENLVGLYRLGVLGKLETHTITDDMIHRHHPNTALGDITTLALPEGISLEGKSVLLVVGGYLYSVGEDFYQVGERTYSLRWFNQAWPQRFLSMRQWMDCSHLTDHFTTNMVNDDQFAVEDLFSDTTIRKLLTMSQSFFVVVDSPELFVERDRVEDAKLPGTFITYDVPNYPLVMSDGRLLEYWTHKEYDRYVMQTHNHLVPQYTFETAQWKELNAITHQRTPDQPMEWGRVFFLKIGRTFI